MSSLRFLGRAALTLGRAHTEASLVEALREVLAELGPVEWVELGPSRRRPTLVLPPRVRARGRFEIDAELTAALTDLVNAALANCETFARVGDVSRRAYSETKELRSTLEREQISIVARSASMRRLVTQVIPQVARHDVSVLLLGETGVGKEVMARHVHDCSPRSSRSMLAVNCGALPPNLVDATLFGYERGAFTGANERRAGLFERANRSTLFLDEVGELSLEAQVRLLRVLERGEVERIGGSAPLQVDVRIVAATHRDLEQMIGKKQFRLDLFHRLAVVPLTIPPLRERPEDLDALVPALLTKLARKAGLRPVQPTRKQLSELKRRQWPGNIRELENTLARALVLSDGQTLRFDAEPSASPEVATFAEASRQAIEAAMTASNNRIHGPTGAAAKLGLVPTTLQSKMKKLGLPRPQRG